MIVIIHSLYFLVKYCLKLFKRRKCLQAFIALQAVNQRPYGDFDAEENITFDPPVYKQRYGAVQEILLDNKWRADIKKIVDFGCAEFGLFQFIKRLCRIEEILEVDIDEDLLKENLYRIQPLTVDYLNRRTEPLTVQVLVGSISDADQKLRDTDVVIGIEIIEHLFPDTLEAVPYNIFGFIKPKMAIFTTPNADFNEVFPNMKRFRHSDHKFEWSRQQFKLWATNITSRFPDYSVSFRGIGIGPTGTEHLGCCSQMAVFERKHNFTCIESNIHVETSINSGCTCKKCVDGTSFGICTYFSCTEKYHESLKSLPINDITRNGINVNDYYKFVEIIQYPFEIDERSPEQKILDELKYRICLLGNVNGRFFNDDLNRLEIPLYELVFNQYTHYTTVCEAREILEKAGYKIEECVICGDLEICVIYEPEMDSRSSTPTSRSDDSANITDKENWSTLTTEGETSEWELSSDLQRGSWTDNTTSQEIEHTQIIGNVYEIVDNLISNLELECGVSDSSQKCCVKEESPQKEKKCNNFENCSESMQMMYDSGYYKSNTTLTTSTQSGSDLLDGDILDDHFIISLNTEEGDRMPTPYISNLSSDGYPTNDYERLQSDSKNIQEHNTIGAEGNRKNVLQGFSEKYKIGNCKTATAGNGNLTVALESALIVTPNVSTPKPHHFKESMKESSPGTSNVKKKKRIKHFESDDDASVVVKNEDPERKIEIREEEKPNEIIVPEVVEVAQVAVPVVENGDLANNNRDMEGNNYPDAQQNGHPNNRPNVDGGNDNENVVLQNDIAVNNELQRNEDVENRNADEEEEANNDAEVASANSDDGQGTNELEIEFASREALFDPNSEIDLLEEFNNSSVVNASNASEISDPLQGILVVGLNVNSDSSDQGSSVLPINADPFPNWLLHLLGTDFVDEGEPHDEPHFYCQGDGVGVHPSFIEGDFDEEHSSSGSDTTSTGSTSDDAIAEPTVSEVEVVSLPDDATDVRPEPNTLAVTAALEDVTPENGTNAGTGATTSSGNESADEYFDTLDESLSVNSNESGNKN